MSRADERVGQWDFRTRMRLCGCAHALVQKGLGTRLIGGRLWWCSSPHVDGARQMECSSDAAHLKRGAKPAVSALDLLLAGCLLILKEVQGINYSRRTGSLRRSGPSAT